MTVSTAPTPLTYAGNGSTTDFPITWKYNAKSHVVATLRSTAGAETVWVLTTNYTLTDPGDTGTLTAVAAPATGETLVITLEPPNTQSSDIPIGGAFASTNVEDGLDLAAQRDAKIEALFLRALRVPKTDTKTGSSLELPIDTDRASKFLAFDADGVPIAAAGTSADLGPVSVFINTLLDDTTAADARTTLGSVGLTGDETVAGNKTFSGSTTFQSSDAGASAGPSVTLDRNSASPAASDVLGAIPFTGRDSGAGTDTYAQVQAEIVDPTAASEDGKLAIQTVVAGTLATRAYVGQGVVVGSPTDSDKGAGSVNATDIYDDGVQLRPLVSGTVTATTSGTSHDYTSIPSWVKRITVMFSGVSTNGTSTPMIQIGDSGGFEATNYLGATGSDSGGGGVWAGHNTGFLLFGDIAAAAVFHGIVTLVLLDAATNTWAASIVCGRSDAAINAHGGGSKALSATLDRVRLTTVNGTDAFDAGSVNIFYE